jgi:hypothetical protein
VAKIINKGSIPTYVGLRGRCGSCGCEFELEGGDIAQWIPEERAYRAMCPEVKCGGEVRVAVPRNGGAEVEKARAFVERAAGRGRG